ncbi:hypothetical protein [Demequina sp. NBRC 110057]|uniref:hypothetical protein n=1 Tax=Demequina sp. NBRC 110057 TaxID=1570346 RepID=UPI0009FDC20C|nr:hypothetical protein [Demequina sp. NBRC 110057]
MNDLWTAAVAATTAPEPAPAPAEHPGWVSEPETSDDTLREATGRGWDEWVAIIDAGPARGLGHTQIADWVKAETDIVSWWWAQNVTVGYERITGLRLPGQMKDGTFTVSRSRSLQSADASLTYEDQALLEASLPQARITRTSKAGVKTPRFTLADAASAAPLGQVTFTVDPTTKGQRLTVTHEKLPGLGACEPWKAFWSAWLAAR